MTTPLITLEDVSVSYGAHRALQTVSGSFQAGTLTAIAGPNGAGKSTLLKVIAGLLRPSRGRLLLAPGVREHMGYLPQFSASQRDYPLSVMQAASTGLWPEIGNAGALNEPRRARVCLALAEVGLAGFEGRELSALSGGEFQRLLFARLLLQEPQVLLLDEPFSAIDAETTAKLIKLLLKWHAQGRTIICVLHDLLLIHKYFPDSFVLAGKCMGRGHTHDLFEQKLLSFDLDMAELHDPNDPNEEEVSHDVP